MTHMRMERRRDSLIGITLNRVIYWAVITMGTSALKFLVLVYLPNMVEFLNSKMAALALLYLLYTQVSKSFSWPLLLSPLLSLSSHHSLLKLAMVGSLHQ